ncbi:hypothetical protein [Cellulomonas sp. KRMCY2]|uniref:hypothetical protein n=1 Tax=Cellulomonas sp. KRMCY2 TaxID=1304865 RepID=UPI0012DDA815|nr:hypothetical protein [Cellulomonas sp. KRMCY2]
MALLTGCAMVRPVPVSCDPPVPADASAAAREYAATTHDALGARRELSDTIAEQNMMMSRDDMRTAATIDADFLVGVRAIVFPRDAVSSADDFIRAVEADDTFLLAAAADEGYYGARLDERERLREERIQAGLRLREALGLPPSACSLNLP